MTGWVIIFCLVLGAALQAVTPSFPAIGEAKLPILLAVVLYFALTRETGWALGSAGIAGLLQDALGQGRVGFHMLCFLLIAWFVNESRDQLFGGRWSTHMLLGAVGSAVMIILLYLMLVIDGSYWMPVSGMIAKTYGTTLLGLVTVPLVFRAIEQLEGWLGHRPGVAS